MLLLETAACEWKGRRTKMGTKWHRLKRRIATNQVARDLYEHEFIAQKHHNTAPLLCRTAVSSVA